MDDFMAITGVDSEDEAIRWLSLTDFDVATAVDVFLAQGGASSSSAARRATDTALYEEEPRRPDPVKRDRLIEDTELFEAPGKRPRLVSVFSSGKAFNPKSVKEEELASLFKPPTDLSFAGPLDAAKDQAAALDKWVLVNIQDESEFASHVLNRDFFRDPDVRSILNASFVLWQQLSVSANGRLFAERYQVQALPSVCVLDPITGKCCYRVEGRDKVKPDTLMERLLDFLGSQPNPSDRNGTAASAPLSLSPPSTADAGVGAEVSTSSTANDEDDEMQRAIALSMVEVCVPCPTGSKRADPRPVLAAVESTQSAQPAQPGVLTARRLVTAPAHAHADAETAAVDPSEKAIMLRVRLPSGANATTQLLPSQPVLALLQFIARQIPEPDRDRELDVVHGHPPRSVCAGLGTDPQALAQATLRAAGLTSNTALTARLQP